MKKLLWIIIGLGVLTAVFVLWNPKNLFFALSADAQDEIAMNDLSTEDPYDDFYMDTLMSVNGKEIGWGGYDMPLNLIFDGKVVSNDPLLSIDSVFPTTIRLSMISAQEDFDLSRTDAFDKMQTFLKPLATLDRYQHTYLVHFDSIVTDEGKLVRQDTRYNFTLDFPKEDFKQREALAKWLCSMISIAQNIDVEVPAYTALYIGYNQSTKESEMYSGDIYDVAQLGEFASNKAFNEWRGDDMSGSIMDIGITTDYRAHLLNDKFVTYGAYVYAHQEPSHGMYTERFYTYDLNGEKMASNDNLFKKGSMDKIKKLVFEGLVNNKRYREFNDVETAEDVERHIASWDNDLITGVQSEYKMPQGALLKDGVIFSFQPYEIECFAAGALHVIVPYSKLEPYMTDWAKSLIKD